MNKFLTIIFIPIVLYSTEYYQHRNNGLQTYPDIMAQSRFKKLEERTNVALLKNIYSILAFTHSIESLSKSPKKLSEFIELLENEYVKEKTIHHFTDLTIARIFLETQYPHLHIGTNKLALSNVFTDQARIEDFIFSLYNIQNEDQNTYAKLVECLYKIQEEKFNRHAELNFSIALSLAPKDLRKHFEKKRKTK